MPTAPAAPVLFTTPTGFFSTFSSAAATGRAVRSATPPGGNGATSVIGREGYVSWPPAVTASDRTRTTATATTRQCLMGRLLFLPAPDAYASPAAGQEMYRD